MAYKLVVVTIFLVGLALLTIANAQSDVYMNSVVLVKPSVYTFYWNYTNTNLTGEIVVRTYGWVSFGITRRNSLEKSDLILAWISGTRTVFVDCHYTGNDVFSDAKQNWQLLNSFEKDGYTTIKFTRFIKLSSYDADNDVDIDVGTPLVSFSWGASDPIRFINYNSTNLGFRSVPLLNSFNSIDSNLERIYSLYYSMPNVVLPYTKSEYFYCAPFTLPANTSTRNFHLTKFATNISAVNEGYIYDWKIYLCPGLADTLLLPSAGECDPNIGSSNTSTEWNEVLSSDCSILGIMWANGNDYMQEFPKTAGYPFGYNTINSNFDTFVIRMHYLNPDLETNVTDSSGVTLYYTPDTRRYDLGSLLLGGYQTWQGLTIPPGTANLKISYFCYDSCTSQIGNQTGIYVLANYLHTYEYGTKISSKIIRNNGEYKYIGKNSYYNSDYQYLLYHSEGILIQPGDQMITTCTYDTTDSVDYVFGGTNEICYNLLYYYPASLKLSTCTSAPTIADWNTFLNNLRSINYLTVAGTLSENQNTSTNILSMIAPVNSYLRQKFQDFYYYTDHALTCSTGSDAIKNSTLSTYVQITPLFYLNDYDSSKLTLTANKSFIFIVTSIASLLFICHHQHHHQLFIIF